MKTNLIPRYRLIIYDLKEHTICSEEEWCSYDLQLSISPRGDYVALLGPKILKLYRLEDKQLIYLRTYSLLRLATCLNFHPIETILAVGDEKGQITFYHFLVEDQNHSVNVKTIYHWHAHKVKSLVFSGDGAYMISGGEEGVLVIWQLASGSKQFLPRLGAHITALSMSGDQSLYAVSLEDNSIQVISSANLIVKFTVQGVKYDQHQTSSRLLLMVEPRNHTAVFNGIPDSLQFYNLKTDSQLMQVSYPITFLLYEKIHIKLILKYDR